MGIFRHTVDDFIVIDDGTELIVPLAFFVTQEAAYALPPTYNRLEYVQGSYYNLYDETREYPQSIPYTNGDTYILNRATYEAEYELYTLYPTLSDAKFTQIGLMTNYSLNYLNGKVVFGANTFFSDFSFTDKLYKEYQRFNAIGALPGGYYINDENYNQIAFGALADVGNLLLKIFELHYETRLIVDTHRTAINALGTITAVKNYDYTTGWPTVPYV